MGGREERQREGHIHVYGMGGGCERMGEQAGRQAETYTYTHTHTGGERERRIERGSYIHAYIHT